MMKERMKMMLCDCDDSLDASAYSIVPLLSAQELPSGLLRCLLLNLRLVFLLPHPLALRLASRRPWRRRRRRRRRMRGR